MVKTIDYYKHWNKNRNKKILDREKKSLNFILKIIKKESKILDAGCGNGKFLDLIKSNFSNANLYGVDFSESEVKEAKKKSFNVIQGDFEDKIKFSSNSFDIINASEVIEHLYNPDKLLEEINRVLKKGGHLVLSTPNLCSWANRILVPLGIQPLFVEVSTKSKLIGAGFLARFKKESNPVGHVRIFNFQGIKDILKANGFEIVEVKGAIFDEGFPQKIWFIDRIFNSFPRLSSHFVILARKNKSLITT